MAEYVERSSITDALLNNTSLEGYDFEEAVNAICAIPAADVRPVVTCAECDWHVDCGYHFCNKWCLPCPDNADFYCAYGERPTAALT